MRAFACSREGGSKGMCGAMPNEKAGSALLRHAEERRSLYNKTGERER